LCLTLWQEGYFVERMAEKKTVAHRTADIYDTLVFIYDTQDDSDETILLGKDNFEMMRSDVVRQADLSTKAAKNYTTKKFESNYFFSLLFQKESPKPVIVKARDVIVNARTMADSMLFLAVQMLRRRNADLPEDGEKIQMPDERKPDFFDDNLRDWIECFGKLPCFTSSVNPSSELMDLLGYVDPNTRQQWVLTLKRLSDRFLHRGVFFLHSDFKDMQRALPNRDLEQKAFAGASTEVKQMDDNEVFCQFIVCVNTHIEKLAKLSSY
jgi:hypothetical protein